MRSRVTNICALLALSSAFATQILAQQSTSVAPNFRGPSADTITAFKSPRAPVESENFVVFANDRQLANKVSREAERFRKELAIEWIGQELPRWNQKCPIHVKIERHAGGETSFAFVPDQTGRSQPIDWRMKIFGPPDRLLDAVLPHEVTHTIFASHFGRPLPRWADEGACTTVEHISERQKNHQMLMQFLSAQPSRGIPFNRMFTMRNYPSDILPLYAQGYSLARFLIQQKGRRHFLDYVSKGLANENQVQVLRAWDMATNEFYGFKDLSDLQIQWLEWVKNGSPDDRQLAKNDSPNPNMTFAKQDISWNDRSVQQVGFTEVEPDTNSKVSTSNSSQSWYKRQMNSRPRVAATQDLTKTRKVSQPTHQRDSRLPNTQTIWR